MTTCKERVNRSQERFIFDRLSLLFFAMDEGLEVEELQRHVGPPLLVDYMWSKRFSVAKEEKNIN